MKARKEVKVCGGHKNGKQLLNTSMSHNFPASCVFRKPCRVK